MTASVTPDTFTKVDFAAPAIAAVAERALARVAAVDEEVSDGEDLLIVVDENSSTSRVRVTGLDPIAVAVESGALEEFRHPRSLSEASSEVTFARLLFEVADRRRADFGGPALEETPPFPERMAWDVNLFGRVSRLGLPLHEPRYRYDFRNRHGFSDAADRIFDELWRSNRLTWAEVVERSKSAG